MFREEENYYEICEDELIREGLDEIFYLKDLKQRKLFLNAPIDQLSIMSIVKHIIQINREDMGVALENRTPIILYITSEGGEVDAGFELIDVIQSSKTPVYTVNLGHQYSMGFLIGIAGHKRFATRNSKFLMHDGTQFAYGSGMKVQDQINFQKRVEEKCKDYILSRSKLTSEDYDSKLRVEWYMFAEEAKKHGFVDYIIGVDCDIDAIV